MEESAHIHCLFQSSREPVRRQDRDNTPLSPEILRYSTQKLCTIRCIVSDQEEISTQLFYTEALPLTIHNSPAELQNRSSLPSAPHQDELQKILWGEVWALATIKSSLVDSNVQSRLRTDSRRFYKISDCFSLYLFGDTRVTGCLLNRPFSDLILWGQARNWPEVNPCSEAHPGWMDLLLREPPDPRPR